jgi:signal transduction histidine kinase
MSTVLLVDDSPADRALFRLILGRAGFSVHELSRGLDAVAKAREIRPHVVVLDVNLPDTDGHAVCRALRADPVCSGLPVLMLTIKGNDDDVLAGLEAGADDYLAKDEAGEIILARVRRLVQFRKLATISVLNEQLAQVGRLVAGIVHEIRAPLTVIRGNAEMIAMEAEANATSSQWVEPILRAVKTLQVRLDHLMAAVRTGPSEPRAVDVLPLLRESLNLFLKGTDPRRGSIAVDLQTEEVVPIVRVDPGRLMQVVLNLLSNAHEAIFAERPEGQIVVRVRSVMEDGFVRVRVDVLDNGPGIAPSHLDRIFEPFFTTKEGGTGYGLYLASEILREHGGRLTAENCHEGGACLSVWLPLSEPCPIAAVPATPRAETATDR